MFGIDTNLLVYAHNTASQFHQPALSFLEDVMNDRDDMGQLSVCLPTQVLQEFIHVITWQRLENPLSLADAIQVVDDYLNMGITIVHLQFTPIANLFDFAE